ncbi:hypothetical protein B0H14DRAFT_3655800 [Mycena olivaceomarginata]|nr:hypothetical protein B0H14DRAFT_3655800 [Mycena olivaceomarginata]
MDDIQLVAHVAAGDLLAFRDSESTCSSPSAQLIISTPVKVIPPLICECQPRYFPVLGLDASTSTCQSTISVKLEPSQASVSICPQETRVKTEDSGLPTIDLTSPARPAVRTRQFVENRKEIIEILSSDDEMEVEASLWPSGASSDPPDPSDSLDHNDSDDEPEDLASVALLTTFWGDTNIISRAIVGPATIKSTGQGRACRVPGSNSILLPVPRKKTAYILDLRDIQGEGWDTDIVFAKAELPILPPPPVSSPYSSPAALQVISPPIEVLNADVDERNIVHFSRTRNPTKHALETVGTTVQSKAKENQE